MQLNHLSLCSGIGGLDLAAEWAGFTTVAQCEIDEYASRVLAKNFKGVPNLNDIRTVTNGRLAEYGIRAEDITVVSAGFPCQPYSLAGKGLGDSDERDLWGEVARVLGEIRPRWFVGENTPGLFARQNQRYFRRVLNDLAALGYRVGWGIWGACDVGAPHKRNRVFVVAYSNGERRNIYQANGSATCQEVGEQENQAKTPFGASSIYGKIPNVVNEQKEKRRKKSNVIERCMRKWQTEPDVGRVANGIPSQVDRIRGIGNAVAPPQAYPIFEAIAEFELSQGEQI